MTQKGHEDPFPSLWLNVRCVIRHGTFAETNGNGRDAPIPAFRDGERTAGLLPNVALHGRAILSLIARLRAPPAPA